LDVIFTWRYTCVNVPGRDLADVSGEYPRRDSGGARVKQRKTNDQLAVILSGKRRHDARII